MDLEPAGPWTVSLWGSTFWARLVKQPGPVCQPTRGSAPARAGQRASGWRVRTCVMRDLPPLTVSVDWAAGVATVTVHGELDHITYSQLQDRLA